MCEMVVACTATDSFPRLDAPPPNAYLSRMHAWEALAGLLFLGVLGSLTGCGTTAVHRDPRALPPTTGGSAPGAELVELYAADRFFEGPVWNPAEEKLYFTAFGPDNQQILRLEAPGEVHVWLDQTQGVNGMVRAHDGRILAAQAYGHRLLAMPPGGKHPAVVETLAADDGWNQPNDVCEAPNGDIYLSDPDFQQRTTSAVYRLAADGTRERVVTDMAVPNGLIMSLDGATLYVADSYRKHWRAYPIGADGKVGPGRVFFEPDTANTADPDGMTIDAAGNLYLAGRGGVWVVRPEGELIEFIAVPEFVSNVTLGGPDGQTLFLTCKGKVYRLRVQSTAP